ncbi:hypothetical protein TSOC_010360 [Tetrabaena socialis]|uniref:Uncharacterized protein n=1 Tax=Tetrabaena socialis TaxID=47790 RepID=A0A2J7ZTK2_9CHLO|nr:hypothetical protein TSOC_010360 [Tetrabaena socialis]|eukprot:PNH03570.1 hypothetical protein TSOC_010360 [Tetrabaena socialis]
MVWGYIIANTSQSPGRLLVFGTLCIGATWVVGSYFAQGTVSQTKALDAKQQKAIAEMPYDNRRMANAQQVRLSSMLKDVAEGRGDDHWNAAMRGTLMPHPLAESKTEGLDKERLAKALSAAKQ